jgi:hypothetical protein
MGGTGLGLAIVKHILNRHRGFLDIDSVLGAGSVFTVFLRQHRVATPDPKGASETNPREFPAGRQERGIGFDKVKE